MLFIILLILLGFGLAQQPGDHTINPFQPDAGDFSILGCSARDSLTSALASCTISHDAAKPGYPQECQDLVWSQGLFSTCTSFTTAPGERVSPITAMTTVSNELVTSTITPVHIVPTKTAEHDLARRTEPANLDSRWLFWNDDIELAEGYPRFNCKDIEVCEIAFKWRGVDWWANHGICGLCRWYAKWQNIAWLPEPLTLEDLHEILCKKYQKVDASKLCPVGSGGGWKVHDYSQGEREARMRMDF